MSDYTLSASVTVKSEQYEKAMEEAAKKAEELEKAAKKASNGVDSLEKSAKNAQSSLKKTGESAGQAANGIGSIGEKATEAGKAAGAVTNSFNIATKATNSMIKAMTSAKNAMSGLSSYSHGLANSLGDISGISLSVGNSFSSIGKKIGLVSFGGMASGAYGLKNALESVIDTGAEFEQTMANVKAISSATDSEMSELTAKARELGNSTKFTATEAGEAFSYMAMAGWKTADMLDGIDAVLNLAAASGEDLADVSDIVTDAITAFGLEAKDASRFADVLAQASRNANTNVSMMGNSFKYVAPVAGAMGYSIEDTAIALGLMANAGVKASTAGTSLRQGLTRLTGNVKEVSELMDKYGISLEDAAGNTKPLITSTGGVTSVIDDLRKAFSGMTETEKTANATVLFGTDAMSGMLAILNATDEDFESLSKSIANANGAAKEMAETMANTLKGQLEQTGAVTESLKLTVYEGIEPMAKSIVSMANTAISNIDKLAQAFFKLRDNGRDVFDSLYYAFYEFSGGNDVSSVFYKIAGAAHEVIPVLKEMNESGSLQKLAVAAVSIAPALQIAGTAASWLGNVIGTTSTIAEKAGETFNLFGEFAENSAKNASKSFNGFQKVVKGATPAANGLKTAFSETFSFIANDTKKVLSGFGETVTSDFKKIESGLISFSGKAGSFGGVIQDFVSGTKAGIGAVGTAFDSAKTKISDFSSKIPIVSETFSGMKEKVSGFASPILSQLQQIGGGLSDMTGSLASFAGNMSGTLLKVFGGAALFGAIIAGLGLVNEQFGTEIDAMLGQIEEKVPAALDSFKEKIEEKLPEIMQSGADLLNKLFGTLETIAPSLVDVAGTILTGLVTGLTENSETIVSGAVSLLTTLADAISEQLPIILPAAMELITTLAKDLLEPENINKLVDSAINLLTGLADGLVASIDVLVDAAPDIIIGLASALIDNAPKILDAGINLIFKLADGLLSAVPKLLDKVPEIISALKDKFLETDWSEVGKNLMNSIWNGIKSLWNDFVVDTVNTALGWLPFDVPTLPYLAKGTDNFEGGMAVINERGGEIVNLPDGTQVIPNDISRRYATEAGRQPVGESVVFDYQKMAYAVASAISGINVKATAVIDKNSLVSGITSEMDKALGRQRMLNLRYS